MRNLLIALMLVMVGCKATQPTMVELKNEKQIRIVDTLVKVVPDSSTLKALLECDSLGRVRLKQLTELSLKNIGLDVTVDSNNTLSVKAKGNGLERRRIEATAEVREKPVPYPVEKRVNYLTSWQWFQVWVGRIACIMVLLYLLWNIAGLKKVRLLNVLARAFKKS